MIAIESLFAYSAPGINFIYILGSHTLPKTKPAAAPPSPSYRSNATPPVFVPKESDAPLPPYYSSQPSYVAQDHTPQGHYAQQQQCYSPQPSSSYNLNNLQNYNTAARGWKQNSSIYRPVTFDKPVSPYTDF